jgi:hypothetical protein
MPNAITIMCVHGLGDHRDDPWQEEWQAAIEQIFAMQGEVQLNFVFVTYDPIFENVRISPWEAAKAFYKLTKSGVSSAVGSRGFITNITDKIKWTAGYVVAWVEDKSFQRKTHTLIVDALKLHKPDILLAHSLGSLVTYNVLSDATVIQDPELKPALAKLNYVSLGSQLGNAFVLRNLTPGRLSALPVNHWYHLYNKNDAVFTAPIQIWEAANFTQINTFFDIDGVADHQATEYLGHRSAIDNMWSVFSADAHGSRSFREHLAVSRSVIKARKPSYRALLVGINDYPNAQDKLEGCVNDVFLMSSVLQECHFKAEDIRICLDGRATAKGILERLEWLLDDPKPGDIRFFYYSGHGATIPEYGEDGEPDRCTETLVPWDFDWSPERAITDDQIFNLYAQLPFDTLFCMVFDCCHSGGMHREGGRKPRGLTPPDDLRHRSLRWDAEEKMWVSRDFDPLNKTFSKEQQIRQDFFGRSGSKVLLGRASALRGQSEAEYDKSKLALPKGKALGPYLPLIIQACGEGELSYEYRHGSVSFGAFTYALSHTLREAKEISFDKLLKDASRKLARLGYEQTPQLVAPNKWKKAKVPWMK